MFVLEGNSSIKVYLFFPALDRSMTKEWGSQKKIATVRNALKTLTIRLKCKRVIKQASYDN